MNGDLLEALNQRALTMRLFDHAGGTIVRTQLLETFVERDGRAVASLIPPVAVADAAWLEVVDRDGETLYRGPV